MHTSISLGDSPRCHKSEQTCSLVTFPICAEQQSDDELKSRTCGLSSIATYHGAVRRQARIVPSLKRGVARTMRRGRKGETEEEETVSNAGSREARIAALVGAPDDNVYEKALRVVGELIDLQRQPRAYGPRNRGSVPLVPQPRGGALQDRRDTNTVSARDARANDLRSTHGGLDDIDHRRCETTAHRHCAAFAEQNKPRMTSVGADVKVLKNNGSPEGCRGSHVGISSMPSHLGAATALADLQGLDLRASFDHDHGMSEPVNNGRKKIKELEKMSAPLFQDGDRRYDQLITLDLVVETDAHVEEGSQSADSLPEMDTGYDTSESGRSMAEELAEQYLEPLHSMLELLPTDMDGRFGSYYSPTSEARPKLQAWPDIVEADCNDETRRQSRFSWTSSIYSDDGLDEKSVWWKPIGPLVVKKEPEQPPPIPRKNPLRLLRRVSKSEPQGYSKEKRVSRNIHNLHLDLSRSNSQDIRKSMKSPNPARRSSRISTNKGSVEPTRRKPQLSLVIPGHISNAMRHSIEDGMKSRQSRTASRKHSVTHSAREAARECKVSSAVTTQSRSHSTRDVLTRSQARTSATSKSHGRSFSTRDTPRTSGYAETLRSARGHTRGFSEPICSGGTSVCDVSSKWNASMPSHETVRRSCIPSLVNGGNTKRRVSLAAATNKRLPPLPVDMKLQ